MPFLFRNIYTNVTVARASLPVAVDSVAQDVAMFKDTIKRTSNVGLLIGGIVIASIVYKNIKG